MSKSPTEPKITRATAQKKSTKSTDALAAKVANNDLAGEVLRDMATRPLTPASILQLQRRYGNAYVQRRLANQQAGPAAAILPGSALVIQRHESHESLTPMEKYRHTLAHAGTDQATWDSHYVTGATFLGITITGDIHQELADRLTRAETALRAANSGQSDSDIATSIGLYSISGRRTPADSVGGSRISNHAFGIAIDVNYRGNPFIGRSEAVDQLLNRASQFMLDEEFHIRQAQAGNVEAIRARYERASNALRAYFALRDDRDALAQHLAARGFDTGDETIEQWLAQINNDFANPSLMSDLAMTGAGTNRDPAAGFIDLSAQLVEALSGQAGLFWGGQYQSGKDLMHFDWRRGTIRTNHRV